MNRGGRPRKTPSKTEGVLREPTLAEWGISYKLASHGRKLAAIPADEFERRLAACREQGTDRWLSEAERSRIMLGEPEINRQRRERDLALNRVQKTYDHGFYDGLEYARALLQREDGLALLEATLAEGAPLRTGVQV